MAGVRPSLGAAILALPLLLTSCGGAEPDSASAQPPVPQVTDCNLGGKPRFSVGYRAHRQTILGCARISPGGTVELIGSRDRGEGMCLTLTVRSRGEEGEGSTLCRGSGAPFGPPKGRDLSVETADGGRGGWVIGGFATARVAAVRFSLSDRGERKTVPASVIDVGGPIAEKLGAPEPFGYVLVGLPDPDQAVEADALDAGGQVIDHQQIGPFPSADDPIKLPSSGQ